MGARADRATRQTLRAAWQGISGLGLSQDSSPGFLHQGRFCTPSPPSQSPFGDVWGRIYFSQLERARGGCWRPWLEARDAAGHPTMHRAAPPLPSPPNVDPAPIINSAVPGLRNPALEVTPIRLQTGFVGPARGFLCNFSVALPWG